MKHIKFLKPFVRLNTNSTSEPKPHLCFDKLNMTGLCQPELVEGLLVLYSTDQSHKRFFKVIIFNSF